MKIVTSLILIAIITFGLLGICELRSIKMAVDHIRAREVQYHTWDVRVGAGGMIYLPEDIIGTGEPKGVNQ